MDSRIQKLFSLLAQEASSPGLRRSAAKQLSIICNTHKDEVLPSIFKLIIPVLLSRNNDARSSATFFLSLLDRLDTDSIQSPSLEDQIEGLDLQKEAEDREPLLASRGNEYEVGKADLKQQRQHVKNVLSVVPGVDLNENIVEDRDLEEEQQNLSPREKSALKRKIRQQESHPRKSPFVESTLIVVEQPLLPQVISILDGSLLSPNWYVRLGALMGIRSLFEGNDLIYTFVKNLLILLALDCFVDFDSGDTTSAPVREEASILLLLIFKTIKNNALIKEIAQKFDFMLSSAAGSWNQSLTCYVIFSKIAGLLTEIPDKIIDSIEKITENLDVECTDEEILSNTLGLLVIFSSHPSFAISKIDYSGLCQQLLKYLPHCEDISSLPTQIFTLIRHFDHPVSSNTFIPFLRHCNKSVRLCTLQLVEYFLDKNLTNYTDALSQQLFQVLLFEEDKQLIDLSQKILEKYETGSNWTRWIKTISVSIDKPLPLEYLYEFRLKEDGTLETIPKSVPNWELGWKAADIMLLSTDVIWNRRMLCAKVIKIPETLRPKVHETLQNSNYGFHKILAFWLGFVVKVSRSIGDFIEYQSDSKVDSELTTTLWNLRMRAVEKVISLEDVGKLLSLEPIECLRESFAREAAKVIDLDPALSKVLLEFDSSSNVWKHCQTKNEIFELVKKEKLVYLFRLLRGSRFVLSEHDLDIISERIQSEFDDECVVDLILSLLESNISFKDYLVRDDYLGTFENYPVSFIKLVNALLDKEIVNDIFPAFIPLTLVIMTSGSVPKASYSFSQIDAGIFSE